MIDRIKTLLAAKGLTSAQFAAEIGVQRSGISHILSGRNKPSLDFILKILEHYPNISETWLLKGEGEMMKDHSPKDLFDKKGLKEEEPKEIEFNSVNEVADEEPVAYSSAQKKEKVIEEPLVDSHQDVLPESIIPTYKLMKIKQIIAIYEDNTFEIFNARN